MARVHLVLGPVGAGKSTYVAKLVREHEAVPLNLDEWMAVLFRPDRPDGPSERMAWYGERVERCLEQIWRVTFGVLASGTDAVLEVGLIRREQRAAFFGRVDAEALDLTLHALDAPREVRRARVEQRNRERGATFAMEVPPAIFELASDLWEPLTDAETDGRDVRVVTTG
ncbi:MAG: ATP-binding protein [Deltaproteobacteria bacterium]|nr:ATP-binding protein [Deltaproteobacteria bacterium]